MVPNPHGRTTTLSTHFSILSFRARSRCGGAVKIIACIEDPLVVKKISGHLDTKFTTPVGHLVTSRAPPRQGLLFTSE